MILMDNYEAWLAAGWTPQQLASHGHARVVLEPGDCRELLRTLPDACIDAIVTDPPYELGFMGKAWDASGIAYDVTVWRESLRVLKPGGHMLAFSGSRTYHRMVVAIEDAGFEIRDQIMWLYGSGFPKSLDVSKAIDKAAGVERSEFEVRDRYHDGKLRVEQTNITSPIGFHNAANGNTVSRPATDAARQWDGWGTALKPAHEPICVARKPLVGTVAANVLAHGTGALNIDGCRVGDEVLPAMTAGQAKIGAFERGVMVTPERVGRWPANIIHDGSDEVLAAFPAAPGAKAPVTGTEASGKTANAYGEYEGRAASDQRDGGGTAARFFYCAKASKADRGEGNTHPTVKPNALMRYLCKLVTPPGGLVLDPFLGSGSTALAAHQEGFRFYGCDLDPAHVAIAARRFDK